MGGVFGKCEGYGKNSGGDGAGIADAKEKLLSGNMANALVTIGLLGGVAVSTFSKTLAMLFGLLVFGVQVCCSAHGRKRPARLMFAQYLASQGYNIIPTTKLQRYVKGIDLRSAVEDNVAFKLSFGLTFALASMASF